MHPCGVYCTSVPTFASTWESGNVLASELVLLSKDAILSKTCVNEVLYYLKPGFALARERQCERLLLIVCTLVLRAAGSSKKSLQIGTCGSSAHLQLYKCAPCIV